jgi:glycosyltransferase involved in cell wall biosynthesis
MEPLNIVHIMRAPVGGLFRHVLDLATEQSARGHRVGLIADSNTGGARAEELFRTLSPSLALGLLRVPMQRRPGLGDIPALRQVMRRIAAVNADVVHGHGAKGGAYARIVLNQRRAVRAYTPHGGSLLFGHETLAGKFYLNTERLLMLGGDLFLFESAYSAEMFRRKIGSPRGLVRVVHNGISQAEFATVDLAAGATDFVFVGELRLLKGVDVLIEAIAALAQKGRRISLTIVGDGPDRDVFRAQIERLGLGDLIAMPGAMPARKAFALGRHMIAPSRAESLPYIVLETAAAGKPLITTRVGGIPEIYGPLSTRLVPAGDAAALAAAIEQMLDNPAETAEITGQLRDRVAKGFSVGTMVDGVLGAYGEAIEELRRHGRR